jgi:hypothetical protein
MRTERGIMAVTPWNPSKSFSCALARRSVRDRPRPDHGHALHRVLHGLKLCSHDCAPIATIVAADSTALDVALLESPREKR